MHIEEGFALHQTPAFAALIVGARDDGERSLGERGVSVAQRLGFDRAAFFIGDRVNDDRLDLAVVAGRRGNELRETKRTHQDVT